MAETRTGVKFYCTVTAAADAVTLIPLEPTAPKSVAAFIASQVGPPTKPPMPVSSEQAQQLGLHPRLLGWPAH